MIHSKQLLFCYYSTPLLFETYSERHGSKVLHVGQSIARYNIHTKKILLTPGKIILVWLKWWNEIYWVSYQLISEREYFKYLLRQLYIFSLLHVEQIFLKIYTFDSKLIMNDFRIIATTTLYSTKTHSCYSGRLEKFTTGRETSSANGQPEQ